jgi:hypothetical protein
MNPINLRVVYLDGSETEVTAIAADLIAFESKFDLSVARLEAEIRLTHLFFLAWHVQKRTGQTKDEFDKWVESVSIVTEGAEQKK